ncbi:MAG: hypothetical protein AB1439_05775 [candidate division FCPU426 bacterium]
MEKIFKTWLLVLSLLLAVFGLALAFFNQSPLFDVLFNRNIDPVFWAAASLPSEASRFQAWAYGVLGATCAGWGVLLAFWVRFVFPLGKSWVFWGTLTSLMVWFATDTWLSCAFGVFFNAWFNTAFMLLFLIPLLGLRRFFALK